MSRLARYTACSVLALSIASGPAFAELTAQEVWDGMETTMQGFGYAVTSTETPGSGALTVSDIALTVDIPEDNSSVSVTIAEIAFVENGDGSVRMVFPASMPITINAAPEGEDTVKMVLDYASTGLEMVVSGEASDMVYTYGADQIVLRLTELVVNGTPVGPDAARFAITMDGVAGTTSTATASNMQITQSLTTDTVGYDFAFNDPESDDSALISGSMASVRIDSSTTLPEGFDPSNPATLASGGFAASATLGYSSGQMQFAATEPTGATSGTTSTGSVALSFAMDGTAMRYDVSATDQAFSISGPDLPIPVNVSMSESAFNLTAPLAKSDTPQDMAFGLTLGGFKMSELLWNMVDPGAVLPRDPATIALNLTGQVTPFVNFFDPAAVAQLDATGGVPGELNALTLNNLTIEAAGAKLGGAGSFTFDNADMQTFGGFPRPNGGVDLTLDGANGLIDKLIAMGLMTSEDAMGARMMMSMFAVPGDGPDNLKSSIQVNEQGHVLANGMRIQ
jgi:hypothetical protein